MIYTLPKLSYDFNALEPHIDTKTMEIHYTKHHQLYVDKLNETITKHPDLADVPLEKLMKSLDSLSIPESDKTALKNHGGGHLNHSLYWSIMGPKKNIDQALVQDIIKTFGSVDEFKKLFTTAAITRFGSGWAWLVRTEENKILIYSTPNQDSPYLQGHTPLIGIDVWEHAYYLNYQNRRADYCAAWWNALSLL